MKTVTTILKEEELKELDEFIKQEYKNIKISRAQFLRKLILDAIKARSEF